MPADEKRKSDDRSAVSLVVDYDGAEDLYRDYTQNLSSGGAFVHTERQLQVGHVVNLQLSFPRLLAPLCISGIVRWVRTVSENDNGVGIEFTDFDEAARNALDAVLKHIRQRDPRYVEPSLRVLLVEDNPHVARLIRDGLESGRFSQTAFDLVGAVDGKEALDLLFSDHFDVLVIDVNLPLVDGPTVIRTVRAEPRYTNLPVIAVSAGGKDAEVEALAAGADFFLEKPMRLRQIIETMKQLLHLEI